MPHRQQVQHQQKKSFYLLRLGQQAPKYSPYHAAIHLCKLVAQFGDVVDMVACANCHAFLHIPSFTCATPAELKKYCTLSHRREWRNMGSRGYPTGGYGLHMELFKEGFCVHTVDHSPPQAADSALKLQIKHSMDNVVHCICLVSADDTDFAKILKTAPSKHAVTVVIKDTISLQQFAEAYWPGQCSHGHEVPFCFKGGLPSQHVVSSNALIAGYAQEGQAELL